MTVNETHAQFRAMLEASDASNPTERALEALWWFIENVGPDDPARADIFFELREIVREARS
jgi:hypothetical protein